MPRFHREEEPAASDAEPRRRTPERAAHPLLALQRSAGNAAVGRVLARTHPAFNDFNYWHAPLAGIDGEKAQPWPGSPDGVLLRLRKTFPENLAKALLHTDAAEADAEPRIKLTETFTKGGGTPEKALELLAKHPLDNVALKEAYDRDAIIREFLGEGGTQTEVDDAVKLHPTGTDGLRAALHTARRGALTTRSDAAFRRMEVLNDARTAMGFPQQPPHVQEMRTALLAADRDAKTPGAQGRADLTSRIVEIEQWAALREPTVLNMTPRTMEVMKDNLPLYGTQYINPLVKALFYTEPYNQGVVDRHAGEWGKQVPMTREKLLSPQQQIDALTTRVMTLWTLDDPTSRPYANLFFSKRAQATLATLETNAVPKATWDQLVTRLPDFDQVVKAVEAVKTAPALLALCVRLGRRDLTGANLTTLIAAGELEIPRGRYFPYHGGYAGVEIETEMTANWRADLWMPDSMRKWADIHIHYNGTQALQANVRFVHIKFDRTIPGAGPTITGHALIAAAYNDGRLDPTWRLT
jgi:hypothetical protein